MVSPSSSEAVPGVHMKVVFSNAVVGVGVTLTKVGTEFEIVVCSNPHRDHLHPHRWG